MNADQNLTYYERSYGMNKANLKLNTEIESVCTESRAGSPAGSDQGEYTLGNNTNRKALIVNT